MSDLFDLSEKSILVTGASSGIGLAISRALSQEGASLFMTGRNPEKLAAAVAGLDSPPIGHVSADLNDLDAVQRLVESVPSLNGLVLNSGILPPLRPFTLENMESVYSVMETNFFAPVRLLNELLKRKKISNGCSIVFNTSIAVHTCPLASAAYSASKSALQAFSRSIALDLAKKKIRSNCVAYGYVKTEVMDGLISEEMIKNAPLGVAEPADAIGSILFLLSDASRWITRSNVTVDSGIVLHQARAT